MAKMVLITGATSGIGKACAYKFAEEKHNLILCGRRENRLKTLKSELESAYSIQIIVLVFDVRKLESCTTAVQSLPEKGAEVDVLINNAGLAKGKASIHEGEVEHWNEMIDTNIKGLLHITRLISPHMVDRRSGHIINICSSAGKEVYPGGNVYCATKHAVDALTQSFRFDLYKHNIRVSQVSPSHVEETEFALVRFDGDQEKADIYKDFTPLKSRDVAEAVYFIASRPYYVNIQDVVMMGLQQASNLLINKNGRQD